MYARVLAAINEHLNSEITARYALRLAAACGARFTAAFVAARGAAPDDIRKAGHAMDRLFREAQSLGVAAEKITETGDPVQALGDIVRREKIDLAFVATRRKDAQRRFFSGTVARRLFLSLPCSVALVRVVHTGRIHPSGILVPLKARFGRIPQRAAFVASLAGAFNARIHVFHVVKPLTRFFHGEIHLTTVEWEERIPSDIGEFLALLRKQGAAVETKLIPGRVGRSIGIEAAARRHDLIVMGASERSRFGGLFRLNPVERVLRETPCDLILLKPSHEDPQPHDR
jgi:nucleotide-binding universal stress UspA family protein